ncbi:LPS export ABC transporter periplasmic protein LptC [Celeribacter halophilus]|jgi:lipopolysaccharide export system protein LptC|uniref:LPS export ABC transporter periplasmic protein LptC n=1 Tax=Celeribacter halophilus TaxID=576117 RepID=UPI001C09BB18|nr:LPS export ABC transporter periplasmic protein LptC [Celeribacter halophilus]MBU2889623.1 LPS export ABC transporter periplasmic protein LptC [Celeribacter halophilus]MDO6510735.1 LPS export ABC transporter periplasmic protein LptC [Celeribacter halophilus]
MARFDNRYSKFVAFAKVALPLGSLAILATLFLFARGREVDLSIPYADVDIETLAREQRVEGPAFATVTQDGAELEISADLVRPDLSAEDVVNSTTIRGALRLPGNGSVTLKADDGVIDGSGQVAELSGHVEIETSTGYTITSERIATMLDISKIESPGTVDAIGPAGDLTAGSMVISQDAETEAYLLVFKDGVKLVYQP